MTNPDHSNADAFWSDRARRGRNPRPERTREHTEITRGMRRPDTGSVRATRHDERTGTWDAVPVSGAGLFDDIPDDPFDDDFGLGTYGVLSSRQSFATEPEIDHELVLEPRRPRRRGVGIDPLLARIGAIVVAAVIAVPVVGAFGGDDQGEGGSANEVSSEQTQRTTADTQPRKPKRTTTTGAEQSTQPKNAVQGFTAGADGPLSDSPMGPAPSGDSDTGAATTAGGVSNVTSPPCGSEYEVAAGDYWLRLAEASGSDLDDLLAVNGATTDTPLYPGSDICLPVGASTPAPPTTQAPETTEPPETEAPTTQPPTTDAPTTTEPPQTDPPPTDPPATTQPPTTDSPPTTSPRPTGSVPDIIRAVWPDHLEQRALEIAWRESNFVPTARNYCCYGLFQIYYDAHSSWLPSVGVNSAEDLFDPYLNSRAAYTLYQRSGGWSPWAL